MNQVSHILLVMISYYISVGKSHSMRQKRYKNDMKEQNWYSRQKQWNEILLNSVKQHNNENIKASEERKRLVYSLFCDACDGGGDHWGEYIACRDHVCRRRERWLCQCKNILKAACLGLEVGGINLHFYYAHHDSKFDGGRTHMGAGILNVENLNLFRVILLFPNISQLTETLPCTWSHGKSRNNDIFPQVNLNLLVVVAGRRLSNLKYFCVDQFIEGHYSEI